jgi:hypothetical protein
MCNWMCKCVWVWATVWPTLSKPDQPGPLVTSRRHAAPVYRFLAMLYETCSCPPFVSPRSPAKYPTGWSRVQSSVVVQHWPLNSCVLRPGLIRHMTDTTIYESTFCKRTELRKSLSVEHKFSQLNIPLIFVFCKGQFVLVHVKERGGVKV